MNDNLDLQTQLKQGRINAYQIEKRFIHKDGHLVYGLLNATLVKNAQNEALYFLGNVQNITERKKAEEALQEKNDLLERVFDSNFDLVALTDLEGKYTLVGKSHEILGYGKDYLIGKNVLSFVHPDDINRVSKEFVHFFKTGENRKAEYRYKCIDGEYLWFETVGTLLKDEKGNPEQILFNTRNVTERKKAEETLRESRELLNVTQQIAKIGGWVYDKKNKSMTWADETYRIHGMDPNEFTPGTPDHIEHSIACYNKEDRATIESAFNRCVEDGTPYSFEFLITTVQRQKKWILTSAQADLENGKVIKVYGHIMDITERKQAEKALQENEEKMRSIYRVAPTGIGLVVNRVLKDVNPRVCEMTGYTRETLLEKNARILYPSQEEYEFIGEEKYKQIRKTGTGKVETVWQKKDGTIINVLLASTPIDKNDYSKGVIFTALDITERKQAEKALVESEEMMRSSQAVAHIGSYSTNLNRNEIEKSQWVCSPELYNVCGIDENYPHTIAAWADFIHPDYREEVFAYHESVVKEKKSFNREYKIIRINDGVERWVHGTGELVYDDQGNPVRIYGAIQDITERKIIENGYVLL